MNVRLATEKDLDRMLDLLSQVLEIHAKIRPDVFIPGTTKYNKEILLELLKNPLTPIYAAVDEDDVLMGYAFCVFKETPDSINMVKYKYIYIDDLCVDKRCRGQHVGEMLFEYVKEKARENDCYEVRLNVWTGNDSAEGFYRKMGMKSMCTQMEYIL